MISIFISTNRKDAAAQQFAALYAQLLHERGVATQIFSLADLPADFFHADMYTPEGMSPALKAIQQQYLRQAEKWLFIIPEYNGSIPGVLKLFIDACSAYDLKTTFAGKKACLTGIATGRAGNLRGMEHFTGVLHYLRTVVLPNCLPISSIHKLTDEAGNITDAATLKAIGQQLDEFVNF